VTDLWQIVLFVHILAMAFFLGGQLFLGLVVVPAHRRNPDAIELGPIARGFGLASVVALALLVASGAALASHFELWSSPTLQAKLGLLVLMLALAAAHLRWPHAHVLQAGVLLTTLVIVYLGLSLAI
jgi:putative copper export protein